MQGFVVSVVHGLGVGLGLILIVAVMTRLFSMGICN